jgi:hypothetical protein
MRIYHDLLKTELVDWLTGIECGLHVHPDTIEAYVRIC